MEKKISVRKKKYGSKIEIKRAKDTKEDAEKKMKKKKRILKRESKKKNNLKERLYE